MSFESRRVRSGTRRSASLRSNPNTGGTTLEGRMVKILRGRRDARPRVRFEGWR